MLTRIFFIFSFFLCSLNFASEKNYKIYDCFTFFNELEILNIHLTELYDEVDHFVIVEATKTFNGKKKPLYYKENKEKFKKFEDKIIHIVLDSDGKNVEKMQRDAILQGLKNAKDDDIVIISDVDEIISSDKVKDLIDPLLNKQANLVRAELRSYKWFFNRWDPVNPFIEPVALTKYEFLKNSTPHNLKTDKTQKYFLVKEAGWHFTHMGFEERVVPLLKALNKKVNHRYSKNTRMIVESARDCVLSPIDETYPKYVQKNITYFKQHNFLDEQVSRRKTLRLMNKRVKENQSSKKLIVKIV